MKQYDHLEAQVSFIKELWNFFMERKKWWLIPMIVVLLGIAALIALTGTSAVAPFVYTVF